MQGEEETMGAQDAIGRNKRWGQYVRRRRHQMEWTQEELAARMRPTLTGSYVSKWEAGNLPDTLSTLVDVARVFGDPLVEVLREAGIIDEGAIGAPLTDAQRSLLAAAGRLDEQTIWATVRLLQALPATGDSEGDPAGPHRRPSVPARD